MRQFNTLINRMNVTIYFRLYKLESDWNGMKIDYFFVTFMIYTECFTLN